MGTPSSPYLCWSDLESTVVRPESGVVMETLRQAIGQRDALLLTIPETTRLDYELAIECSRVFF